MKKFAWMIAALSLCACSMVACGDDDDKDDKGGKAAIDASCNANEDCESGVCTDKKCVAASSDEKKDDGADCSKAEDCKSGVCTDSKCAAASSGEALKDGGAACEKNEECKSNVCTDKVCEAESTGENCNNFEPSCSGDIAYTSCENGEIAETDCSKNTDGKTKCDKGVCVEDNSEGNCFIDSDCTDPVKKYCGLDHKCTDQATDGVDARCAAAKCEDKGATCVLGICVTDAMKQMNKDDAWLADATANEFCDGDKFYYKTKEGKADVMDCKEGGYKTCVVFADPKTNDLMADCGSKDEVVAECASSENNNLDVFHIHTCLNDTLENEAYCLKDIKGDLVVVPDYNNDVINCSEDGKVCEIADHIGACK